MTDTSPLVLAQNLLRHSSVTPAGQSVFLFMEDTLKQAGFAVHRPIFSEPGTPDVENLYARLGTGQPYLLFAGHVDVVPPGDAARWTHDPFAATIHHGELYGRGAVDMKGGVACMMAAALQFLRETPDFQGSIGFLITGDEEGPAVNGTVKLLEWAKARGERFDHCILGEPTNPDRLGEMIKIGRRGSLTGHLIVHGKQGHVGYPKLADNPIRGMLRLLDALMREPLDEGTDHFEASNLEVTTIDVGNPARNVIPAEAQAVFNIRFNDVWTPETLAQEIERRAREAAGNAVRYTLTFKPTNAVSFITKPDAFVHAVADAIEAETGLRPKFSTSGGTSDARFIKNDCPVVEFGLVGATMHQVDERVAIADLDRLTAIYLRAMKVYFAR